MGDKTALNVNELNAFGLFKPNSSILEGTGTVPNGCYLLSSETKLGHKVIFFALDF